MAVADMYSSENMAKLREENQLQFVVAPLQRRAETHDNMFSYVDATELVPRESVPRESLVEDGDSVSFEEEDDMFRQKQIEAAKALRAKMRQNDSVIHDETTFSDAFDSKKQHDGDRMAVDEEGEAQEDEFSDGEADERRALDAEQLFTGRHYFQDAVHKKNNDAMETVRGKEKEVEQFFNAPDADDIEWELELLKRSGVKRSHQSSSLAKSAIDTQRKVEKRVEIEPIPNRVVEPLSEEDIIRRIENDISQLHSISSLHESRLASIESAKAEHSEFLEKSADSAFTRASDDLRFFEELNLYVVDLMDCVESKLQLIGEVEEQMFAARLRRQKKTQLAIKNAFQSEFSRISSKKTDVATENTLWMEWRSKHRAWRGEKSRGSEPLQLQDPHLDLEEGYSSDEETNDADQLAYEMAITDVRHAAESVFEDAQPEFSDLRLILARFSEFRRKYQFSYQQAHVQSELNTLLAPFVRLETVSWDPLKNLVIFDWPWFYAVDEFDMAAQSLGSHELESGAQVKAKEGEMMSSSMTSHLCSDIASETLFPRVKDTVKFFWRQNSHHETMMLQQLLGKFRILIAPALLSDLLVTIHMSLQHAIININLPTNQQANQASDYGRIAFVRLLKFIDISLRWKPYFSPDAISNLIWNNIVNEKMIPYLKAIVKDKSTCWTLTSYLLSALGPYYAENCQQPTTMERSNPMNTFLHDLEQDSLGHYETFEISQHAREYWDSCTSNT